MKAPAHQIASKIFDTSTVIDIDLSRWYHAISLYVISDHIDHSEQVLAGYRVSFIECTKMYISFEKRQDDDPTDLHYHPEWRVGQMQHRLLDDGRHEVILHGDYSSDPAPRHGKPVFLCECVSIDVVRMQYQMFNEIMPGWEQSSGFARPGPEFLYRRFRNEPPPGWPVRSE